MQLSATSQTRTVPITHAAPAHPPPSAADLVAAARLLTGQLAALPAEDRVRVLAELGGTLHEVLAGALIGAIGEAAEEGLGYERIRAAAGPGHPFLRSALGLVGA